jgi:alpha-beta hydrolase superfamily lysophospholipase
MRPLIVLVHGYATARPAVGIGRLAAEFERHGFEVVRYDCGTLSLADVRLANPNIAAGLLSLIRSHAGRYVLPVGHSNGCALIDLADQLQTDQQSVAFERAAYISPALGRKTDTSLSRIDVYHTLSDSAVWWARMIPWRRYWGDMGRVGYRGRNRSYINHDATKLVTGHSGWWTDEGVRYLRSALVNPLAVQLGLIQDGIGFR